MVIWKLELTTKSGRTYLTQIAPDANNDLVKEVSEITKQLEYELGQLL